MLKLLLFFTTFVYAQNLNIPSSPMVLTDVLLTKNFTSSHLSSGGGSIGGFGGGDTTDRRRLASWFYGDRQIQACSQVNKYFGLNDSEIQILLQEAILIWKNYFKNKQINKNLNEKVNLSFNLRPMCQGGEDLVFYFGTGPINQNLLDLRAFQSLSNPVAYANKTHMSEDFKWSKGYIRFVEDYSYALEDGFFPDWSNKNHFLQILIHEIGHVLGFAHIPGTIMTGSIVRDTLVENKNLTTINLSVDVTDELYPCLTCYSSYDLVSSTDQALFSKETSIHFLADQVRIQSKNQNVDLKANLILKKDIVSSLISIFESEDDKIKLNHIYFLNYLNADLVFVREGIDLKIYRNGEQVAQFLQGSIQ